MTTKQKPNGLIRIIILINISVSGVSNLQPTKLICPDHVTQHKIVFGRFLADSSYYIKLKIFLCLYMVSKYRKLVFNFSFQVKTSFLVFRRQ